MTTVLESAHKTERKRKGTFDRAILAAVIVSLFQFVVLVYESQMVYSRGELTSDYESFAGAVMQIASGVSNPTVLVGTPIPYISSHFELITWPIAYIFVDILRLPVHVLLLDLLQALPTASIGFLASVWAKRAVDRKGIEGSNRTIAILLPSLIAFSDVWFYKADSFDFHYQALQASLAILAILMFDDDKKWWGYSFISLLALTGDTSALVLFALGVWLFIQKKIHPAFIVTGVSLLVLGVPALLHDNRSDTLAFLTVSHLLGIKNGNLVSVALGAVTHPLSIAKALIGGWPEQWAILGGSGIVGAFSLVGVLAIVVVASPIVLSGILVSYAGSFQVVPEIALVIFGTGPITACLFARSQRLGRVVAVGSMLSTVAWLSVFGGHVVGSITSTSNTEVGASLRYVDAAIGPNDEVVAPNASLGMLASHSGHLQQLNCHISNVPLDGRVVDVVADPWRGIQLCSPAEILGSLSYVANLVGAKVVGPLPGGVYWVRWNPGPARGVLTVISSSFISGGLLHGSPFTTGVSGSGSVTGAIVSRPTDGMVAQGVVGYVKPNGGGMAVVHISVSGVAQVQVFDDTTGELLARRYLQGTGVSETVSLPFKAPKFVNPNGFYEGVWPFVTRFYPPHPFDPIEVRVWSPKGSNSSVTVTSLWVGLPSQAPSQ